MTTNDKYSRRRGLCALLSNIGLIMIAAATVTPLLARGFPESGWYKWVFTAGAAVCLAAALFNPADAAWPMSRRRWHRIEGWSAIFFCAAAFFLYYPAGTPRDWLAFTMAGAVIKIITFFRSLKPYNK